MTVSRTGSATGAVTGRLGGRMGSAASERARPVVYIAGPYSKPDPCENTHAAIEVANRLLDVCTPLVPHLSHFWHTMTPKPYEAWLAMDLDYLAKCDALLRFGGESSGADGEVAKAREWGIPVFTDEVDLRTWLA